MEYNQIPSIARIPLSEQVYNVLMDSIVSGSLEAGKQADIVICRGNPALRFDNFVERTIMAGKEVFRREAK